METQLTFARLEDSFVGEGKLSEGNEIITITAGTGRELLRIMPSGEVIAPDLESASEAGRVFVEGIRTYLCDFPIYIPNNTK